MQIQVDSREKARAIKKILSEFEKQNINYFVSKLYVGDYMSYKNPMLIVDRKQNLNEVYSNVCHDHDRFVRELLKAKDAGIHIVLLVEHSPKVKKLEDVTNWKNPRLKVTPYAWDGQRLYNVLKTMMVKYGFEIFFCDKTHTGQKIIEILGC